MTGGDSLEPDYKNKSETVFAVAIICLGFVAETMNVARVNPRPATVVVLSILAAVGVGSLVIGVAWHRRYKATSDR